MLSIGSELILIVPLDPVCPLSIGEVQIGEVGPEQAQLIAAADQITRGGTRAPIDLNLTGEQGQHDQVNSGGLVVGVEDHGFV